MPQPQEQDASGRGLISPRESKREIRTGGSRGLKNWKTDNFGRSVMGKGSGEQKIAVAAAGSGSQRVTGKHSKEKVGIPFTPVQAFGITIGLIVATLVLHIVGRLFTK